MRYMFFRLITLLAFTFFVAATSFGQTLSSPQLIELAAELEVLQSEAEELGGSRVSQEAITNVQGEADELRQIAATYEQLADDLQITQAELQRMKKDAEAMSTDPGGSGTDKFKRKTAEAIAKRLLQQAAKRFLKVAGFIADGAEEAYLRQIKSQTVAALREYIKAGQLQQSEVSELLTSVYKGMVVVESKRRRLIAIQRELRDTADRVAVERQRLADAAMPATNDAVLTPDFDEGGDEEERKKYNEEGVQPAGNVVVIDWKRDDLGLNAIDTYVCPPNPGQDFSDASLVGTDRYLTKSPVCLAAAHVGLFSVELGGRLRLTFFQGQDGDAYVGSKRNGIKSGSWNRNWGGFSVSAPR